MEFNEKQLQKFYRYAMSLTKNSEDAKDLLQTSIEKWLLASMDEIKAPESYFIRIIRNTFLDHVRKWSKRVESPLDDVQESKIISLDDKVLEDHICDKDQVFQLLEELSYEERELLFLWAVEGYSFQEISTLLNTPRGTLLARIHRMKKRLQQKEETMIEVHP